MSRRGSGSPTDDEERITPAGAMGALMRTLGLRREDLLHGETVIGDFLGQAYDRLVGVTGAQPLRTLPGVNQAARATVRGHNFTLASVRMGAPVAAMVVEQYAALGARSFLFVGAAGSLQRRLGIGSLVAPTEAVVSEGTSRHYGVQGDRVPCPSPHLVDRLLETCRRWGAQPHTGLHWTTDAPFRELVSDIRRHSQAGVLSVDMEVSALFSVACFRGLEAAAVLAISDEVHGPWNPGFTQPAFLEALGRAADAALEVAIS